MLAIFPASGGLGGATLQHLFPLLSSSEYADIVLISRHPEKLQGQNELGAVTRKADYDEPDSLEPAFEGVSTLCLISYASNQKTHRIKAHKLAIDAALRAGVSKILYCSLAFGGPAESVESVAHVMAPHLETEAYLKELAKQDSDFSYSIVREGLYSESTPIYTAYFDPSTTSTSSPSVIRIPHDGAAPGVAWAAREELGEATAKILLSFSRGEEEYKNRTVLLSGPRVLTLAETVDTIASTYGLPNVKIEEVSVEEYASQPSVKGKQVFAAANGDEEDYALKWATSWEAIRRGETAVVNGELERILGRKPESFESTLRKIARK